MPHTYIDVNVHIVFGTLNRKPSLRDSIRVRVFSYLRAVAVDLKLRPIRVGGWVDHVHILAALPATVSLEAVARDLKSRSSGWVRSNLDAAFRWQRGYGAFSVSRGRIATVERYIANQEEHHRRESFEEEYQQLLRESGIAFDPAFLWS